MNHILLKALTERAGQRGVMLGHGDDGGLGTAEAAAAPDLLLHGGGETGFEVKSLPLGGLMADIPEGEESKRQTGRQRSSQGRFSPCLPDQVGHGGDGARQDRLSGEEAVQIIRQRGAIWVAVIRAVGEGFEDDALQVFGHGWIQRAGRRGALIYTSIPTVTGATADVVWGGLGASSLTLNSPVGAYFDGTRLFVADRGNDRVLVFNSLPTSASQPADAVLGQSTFNSRNHNQCNCTTAAAYTLWGVHFVYWDGCRLIVSDKQNHRVLIY